MARPARTYVKEMAKAIRYYAVWQPTVPLRLGDIGVLKNKYEFVPVSDLSAFGIKFKKVSDPTANDVSYETKGSVSMSVSVEADVDAKPVKARTKVGFAFAKDNSVVFRAKGVKSTRIADQIALGKLVTQLWRRGRWDKDYRIVTEVLTAASTTILLASSSKSEFELQATGDVSAKIDIADASLGWTWSKQRMMAYNEVAAKGLTPLCRLAGLRSTGLFRRTSFDPVISLSSLKAVAQIAPEAQAREAMYFGEEDMSDLFMEDDDE